ncbi:MAG: ATP-binding protein [Scytonematopsis contorta HA4267-MV1]|nr:ATP-binding protein [Scytonematopsis contorta HA4267-MV1]
MPRWFNISGPCRPEKHYMLSATVRLPNLTRLIQQESYFVIHAPRQTGKTTAMLALAKQLTESGNYAATLVSVELGAPFSHDPFLAETTILDSWQASAKFDLPENLHPPNNWDTAQPGRRIQGALQAWSQASKRPLILFIDEIDSLRDETLISILRQLRDGYRGRPTNFPISLGLIGLRDVRDYKVASGGKERLNTASPFNIKDRSLTMRDFNAVEVAQLYQQHTDDTGQVFTKEASQMAYDLTQGQPWLVNALAKEIVEELLTDTSVAITVEHINQAKEILIARKDTHLDSLADRLTESRVKVIIEPMLAGDTLGNTPDDDRQYLVDLGLLRREPNGGLVIANPIYREVIPRVLTQGASDSLPSITPTWLNKDGELDIDALLSAFMDFWRQHGEPLLNTTSYQEIAPHIVLMSFLHRVVNGGGTLEREYAIGNGRMDLCLKYKKVTLGIEVKTWRDKIKDPEEKGLDQLETYLARIKADYGWLCIFDRRLNAPAFIDRLQTRNATTKKGRNVVIIRA